MNHKLISKWSDFVLNETLKTYDIDFVLNHIEEELSLKLIRLDFDISKSQNKIILSIDNLIIFKDDISDVFNYINSLFIDRNGWFPSIMTLLNIRNQSNILKYNEDYLIENITILNNITITYEPKFDIIEKLPEKLYHISIKQHDNKILINGLIPKSNNKKPIYLDRIYVCTTPEDCYKLIPQLKVEYIFNNNEYINTEWILYEIDSSELDIHLYKDPNYKDKGYYIIDNINPVLISTYDKG